ISFKKKSDSRVGDRYVVFKTVAEVKHPVTGVRYGYVTKVLGTLKVERVSDRLTSAMIQDSFDEIHRGDRVGPYGEQLVRAISPRANEKSLGGFIIGTMEPSLTIFGENHFIIVDKGARDGVQPGNTFTVIRQSDLGGADFTNPARADERLPVEDIA